MLRGRLDTVDRERIAGWALDEARPELPVSLVVTVNETMVARVLADEPRADLVAAGLGHGRHGFVVRAGGLSPLVAHSVRVRREADGAELAGSPYVLSSSPSAASLAEALDDVGDDLDGRIGLLATALDRLLQRRADRDSGREAVAAFELLRARWGRRLIAEADMRDRPGAPGRQALVVDATLPVRGRDGGSTALLSHVSALQRLGYTVTMAPTDMQDGPGADRLRADGVAVVGRPWCASVEELLMRQSGRFDVVYLHRLASAERYAALARHANPGARIVYSVADLHHLRVARQAAVEGRPELKATAQALCGRELMAAMAADGVITHSAAEAGLLRQALPGARVHVVPWAVPARPVRTPFAGRRGVAFIGNFGHAPNRSAAHYLVEHVMPLVWRGDPAVPCLLVGAELPAGLRTALPAMVDVLGVVQDLAEVFGRVRLTVAPLLFGAGVKAKVLESLAAGVPCACTPVAAEGMGWPGACDEQVATDLPGLAGVILRLHGDTAANAAVGDAAIGWIGSANSEAAVDAALEGAIGGVV